jgi:uncharacterized SAM-binding protein YcdF (DUF218 family)
VSARLLNTLENQYLDRGPEGTSPAQAIVVLGGAVAEPSAQRQASALGNSSDRLLLALRLYHAGKAPLILLSGGNNPLLENSTRVSEAAEMRALLEEWGIPSSAMIVEETSVNTHENSVFSYRLLAARGISRIILVTSAFHMPRAAATFRKTGFDVVSAPADFHNRGQGLGFVSRLFPNSKALEDSSLAMHEWLGIFVYRLKGWE